MVNPIASMIDPIDIKRLWGGKTVTLSGVDTLPLWEGLYEGILIYRAWNEEGFADRYTILLPTARTICEASAECEAKPLAAAAKPALVQL